MESSAERVGRLYPILVDKHGNIVDGRHRLAVDEGWPKMKLEDVQTEEDRLLARLISNVCRRRVSGEEKSDLLGKLGNIYLSEGVERGDIAHRIAEETGMSYRWVMKYLPDKYKKRPGLGGPSKTFAFTKDKKNLVKSKVARLATGEYQQLFSDTQEKVLSIKKYANTRFVSIMLEKKFYNKVEKIADKLGAKPDTIINNTLTLTLKKLEGITKGNRG